MLNYRFCNMLDSQHLGNLSFCRTKATLLEKWS